LITVIRIGPSGELVAVTRLASLPDAFAVAASHPAPGSSFLVEGERVARLAHDPDLGWRLREATGFQIIGLDDALNGAKELYRLATRPIALAKLLQTLEQFGQSEIEELPVIRLERLVRQAA
jgi:hypothetical protein